MLIIVVIERKAGGFEIAVIPTKVRNDPPCVSY